MTNGRFGLRIEDFGLEIKRDLQNFYKRDLRNAVSEGIEEGAEKVKQGWRRQIRTARLGTRLQNTVRKLSYPKGGQKSLNAAAIVYTKAPHIIGAYDKGVVIRAKSGRFLAIPTANVPRGSKNRKRLTPKNWPKGMGELRFVPLKNGRAMLVVDDRRATYTKAGALKSFAKAGKSTMAKGYSASGRHGLVTVPMFILIPQASVQKRLDVRRVAAEIGSTVPTIIDRRLRH